MSPNIPYTEPNNLIIVMLYPTVLRTNDKIVQSKLLKTTWWRPLLSFPVFICGTCVKRFCQNFPLGPIEKFVKFRSKKYVPLWPWEVVLTTEIQFWLHFLNSKDFWRTFLINIVSWTPLYFGFFLIISRISRAWLYKGLKDSDWQPKVDLAQSLQHCVLGLIPAGSNFLTEFILLFPTRAFVNNVANFV